MEHEYRNTFIQIVSGIYVNRPENVSGNTIVSLRSFLSVSDL